MDAPYNVHLSNHFTFDEVPDGKGLLMSVFFVDALTGILKVYRVIGLGNEFTANLLKHIQIQRDSKLPPRCSRWVSRKTTCLATGKS